MTDKDVGFFFQIVAGILGIIAFLWNLLGYLWTYVFSHLQMDLSNEKIKTENFDKLKITTIVENKGSIAKAINFSFILISPENESFKDSLGKISDSFGLKGKNQESLTLLHLLTENKEKLESRVADHRFAIFPLPYFYNEQFQIGNEKVKYASIIDLANFKKNQVYNIRFVAVSRHLFNIYLRHRSTSDVFIN